MISDSILLLLRYLSYVGDFFSPARRQQYHRLFHHYRHPYQRKLSASTATLRFLLTVSTVITIALYQPVSSTSTDWIRRDFLRPRQRHQNYPTWDRQRRNDELFRTNDEDEPPSNEVPAQSSSGDPDGRQQPIDYLEQSPSTVPPQNITVSPGDRAVLKCRIDNLGSKSVTWRRQSESHPLTIGLYPFAPDSRLSVDYNQRTNEWSLIIQDVGPNDAGVYHCQVTSKDEHDNTFDVRLTVKTVYVAGTDYVELGSPIRLSCNATPSPSGDLSWFRDDVPVQTDSREGVYVSQRVVDTPPPSSSRSMISDLVIQRSRVSHAGDYTCRSSANGDSAVITLNIINDFLMNRRFDTRGISAERITGGASGSAASTTVRTSSSSRVHIITIAVIVLKLITPLLTGLQLVGNEDATGLQIYNRICRSVCIRRRRQQENDSAFHTRAVQSWRVQRIR